MSADFVPSLWVSNSSIGDYLKCPRAYYLKNIYKLPQSGNKIQVINPALTLGQTVHNVLESLSKYKAEERFTLNLLDKFEQEWSLMSGERGGFKDPEEEAIYKHRGKQMIERVISNPGPLINKALILKSPDQLPPRYCISLEHNILLCGKIDWLEYLPDDDSVHIIDFKTGKHDEDADSLQLPIYALLVKNCQKRNVSKISYWYIDRENTPTEMKLPNLEEAHDRVMEIALRIKTIRQTRKFDCARGGCFACMPLEAVVSGNAKQVGQSGYQDIYILNRTN